MAMISRCALLILILAATPSCFRTVYTNLHPEIPVPSPKAEADRTPPQYWRHFFVFGWVPDEMVIDAEHYCDGTGRIDRVESERSLAQGVIAAFAGYYINIYSPYTGRVVCDRHVRGER